MYISLKLNAYNCIKESNEAVQCNTYTLYTVYELISVQRTYVYRYASPAAISILYTIFISITRN